MRRDEPTLPYSTVHVKVGVTDSIGTVKQKTRQLPLNPPAPAQISIEVSFTRIRVYGSESDGLSE